MNPYGDDSLIGTAIALPILSIIAVWLRFYVRLRVRRTKIGADDWSILLSVYLVCAQAVAQVLSAIIGIGGRDPKYVDQTRIDRQVKINHSVVVIEKVTYTAIKLSVLFLYRRIFGVDTRFRSITSVFIILIVLWGTLFLFLESFLCISAGPKSTGCAKQEWALLWFAITEVLGDIAILSLPYPQIRKLQMSGREKIGVAATFALGTLSTIIGIIRLGYVAKSFHAFFHPDFMNKTGAAPGLWTTAEVSMGIVAACLPPMGALIRKIPGPMKYYSSYRYDVRTLSPSTREVYGMQRLGEPDLVKPYNQKAWEDKVGEGERV